MSRSQSLPLVACMAYSAPYISGHWLFAPMGLLQGIYGKYYGLPLTTMALLILLIRFSDVITDPLVGYYSDRYFKRNGTRKPFVLLGGLLLMLGGYFLYVPTDLITLQPLSKVSALYFVCWSMVFFLGWTFFDLSHSAWANELAPSAQEKTRLFSFRAAAVYVGLIVFYAIPLLPVFETSDITPEVLRISVIMAVMVMVVCLYGCLKFTPSRYSPSVWASGPESRAQYTSIELNSSESAKAKTKQTTAKNLLEFLQSLLTNKPLLLMFGAIVFKFIGAAMFGGMLFIYVDVYLGLGHYFAQIFILSCVVSLISIPIWRQFANWWGKKITWILAILLTLIAFILVSLLKPGETHFYQLLIVNALVTAVAACTWSITTAMFAEVVDYSHWKYRVEQTATYFSLYTFTIKLTASLAMSLGLGIAGWYGLDVTASSHDEESARGLRLVMSWIPAGFTCLALMFIALSPINDRRHTIIRRRLDSLAARANRVQENRREFRKISPKSDGNIDGSFSSNSAASALDR